MRLEYIEAALDRTPASTEAMRAELSRLFDRLDDVEVALNGDRTLASRNEPTPMSINARLNSVRSSSWQSQAPVAPVHADSLAVAEVEFVEVLDQIRDMEVSVDQFESELDELGAPWTPGRLPSWEAN